MYAVCPLALISDMVCFRTIRARVVGCHFLAEVVGCLLAGVIGCFIAGFDARFSDGRASGW